MSEFRKDGGGDFDKRGGATPPSSGSGASGIDPFGFKHEVQAALRAEHCPSPEVMDLIQRWRIPEHVVRAVQAHVEGNLSEHNALSSLHRDIKPVADRDATSDFHVHTAIPGGARFRFSSERSPVVAYVPFSLTSPRPGTSIDHQLASLGIYPRANPRTSARRLSCSCSRLGT